MNGGGADSQLPVCPHPPYGQPEAVVKLSKVTHLNLGGWGGAQSHEDSMFAGNVGDHVWSCYIIVNSRMHILLEKTEDIWITQGHFGWPA